MCGLKIKRVYSALRKSRKSQNVFYDLRKLSIKVYSYIYTQRVSL